MLAILFATGETNKLQPLTTTFTSPMVPIVNRPAMSYVVELLARNRIRRILVSLHHQAGEIESYFGDGRRWGVKLEYILQRDAWGTAGALKWAGHALDDTFIFMPADSIIDLNLTTAIDQHVSSQSLTTVVVHGEEEVDTGIYIFEPRVLEFIPPRTPFDIHEQLLPVLKVNGLSVNNYQIAGYWNALATLEDYLEAQQVILSNVWEKPAASGGISSVRYPLLQGRQISRGIWVGQNNVIHPTARLVPPVYIGENCWVGQAVELGPEAFIGSNVIVDREATIAHSVVLDHTYVGQLVNIEKRLINKGSVIDIATGDEVRVVDPFLIGRIDQRGIQHRFKRLIDFTVAFLLLLILIPFLLLITLLLLVNEGRVFDRIRCFKPQQSNIRSYQGFDSLSFDLLHFHIPDASSRHTLLRDFLERLEWYRLPELWNVVKGDMGLVGVKPTSPEEVANVAEAWQQKPYDYPPGFTGLWYVQSDPDSKPDELAVVDAFYTATRNWQEDLRLFLRTTSAWMKRVRNQGGQ